MKTLQEALVKKVYTVAVPIHGVASVVVNAANEEEAVKIAMKHGQFGENDYAWYWDINGQTVVINKNESNPEDCLKPNGELDFDKLKKKGWIIK